MGEKYIKSTKYRFEMNRSAFLDYLFSLSMIPLLPNFLSPDS